MSDPKTEILLKDTPTNSFSSPVNKEVYDYQKKVSDRQIAAGCPKPDYIFHDLKKPPTTFGPYLDIIYESTSSPELEKMIPLSKAINILVKKSMFNDTQVEGYDEIPTDIEKQKISYSDNSLAIILNQPLDQDNFQAICNFLRDVRQTAGFNYTTQDIVESYSERLSDYPKELSGYYIILDEISYYQHLLTQGISNITLDPPFSDYLTIVKTALSRFPDLIETSVSLLNHTENSDVIYDLGDPVDIASQEITNFQDGFLKRPFVIFNHGEEFLPFYMDTTIVSSLLGKIIDNAWKYGFVVDIESGEQYHPTIEVKVVRDDAEVVISVTDHGIGLTNPEIHKFNDSISAGRTMTAVDSGVEGKGEGLAGDRKLAIKSGIKVSVISTGADSSPVDTSNPKNYKDKFTCFSVRIPIRTENPSCKT